MPTKRTTQFSRFAVLALLQVLAGVAQSQTFNFSTLAGNAGYGSVDGPTNEARFYFPEGITVDAGGNVYVADTQNSTIRRVDSTGLVTTLAGLAGDNGSANGIGADAQFNQPQGVAVDINTNLYVVDTANFTIRELSPVGTNWAVTTIAGSSGVPGSSNGIGANASFRSPGGIALYEGTNLVVADTRNSTIRLLAPVGTNWMVSTLAGGAGTNGFRDGTNRTALFNQPVGVAADNSRELFVADLANDAIRKITPVGTNWVTTTIASNLNSPTAISIDASNNLYLTLGDDTVRKLAWESTNWILTTVAGISTVPGSSDGTNGATFNDPHGIATASNKVLYVADSQNNTIREITGDGTVGTLAGLAGGPGSTDGFNDQARFNAPLGLAVDAGDNVYVADSQNNTIRQITPAGDVFTLAGVATNAPGDADGLSTNTSFNFPAAVAVDSQQNVYVADYKNNEIRKLTQAGNQWQVSTLAGHANANYAGPITNVIGNTAYQSIAYYYTSNYVNYFGIITNIVNQTTTITVIAFTNVQVIRVTNIIAGVASIATNVLSTNLFQLPPAPLLLNGTVPNALFNHPSGVALDALDNLYVADGGTNGVRVITPGGTVTTLQGSAGSYLVNPLLFGTNQLFYHSSAVTVDAGGNVYVADVANDTIREIGAGGAVTTIAGSPGLSGYADGTNNLARFSSPVSLSVDARTNLYVADSTTHILRRITPVGTNWVVTTIGGEAGMPGSADGVGTTARFDLPGGIALDGQGKLYIADTGNNTIRLGGSVTEPVSLQISQSLNEIIVTWPGFATGYTLQTSTDLINWTPVGGVLGSEYVISNSTAKATVFYRLYKP